MDAGRQHVEMYISTISTPLRRDVSLRREVKAALQKPDRRRRHCRLFALEL